MKPRWPQRTTPIPNGSLLMVALLILGGLTRSDFIYGLQVLWFLWWMATGVADWIDRRRDDLGDT